MQIESPVMAEILLLTASFNHLFCFYCLPFSFALTSIYSLWSSCSPTVINILTSILREETQKRAEASNISSINEGNTFFTFKLALA